MYDETAYLKGQNEADTYCTVLDFWSMRAVSILYNDYKMLHPHPISLGY